MKFRIAIIFSCLIFVAVVILSLVASREESTKFPTEGWYAPAVKIMENEKGDMICKTYDGEYFYYSNTVTGVVTKEKAK